MKGIFYFLSIILASGCASVKTENPKYESGYFPNTGVVKTVNVGQVMVSEYNYLSEVEAVLIDEAPNGFWEGRKAIPAGSSLKSAVLDGEQVFCQFPVRNGTACLRDTKDNGYFDRAYALNAFGLVKSGSIIQNIAMGSLGDGRGAQIDNIKYRLTDQEIRDGFKYDLIYQGRDDDTIYIAYREYTDDLLRSAFSQRLSYTMNEEKNVIQFRDVEIAVEKATNRKIKYNVINGF